MSTDRIQQITQAGQFTVWYHARLPVNQVQPLMALDRLLAICNQALDLGWHTADAYQQEELARLVRINWFVQDLSATNRIIKPVLLQPQAFNLVVQQGDTRLMALEACPWIATVPALVSLRSCHRPFFESWTQIHTEQQLTDLLGLEPGCVLLRDDVARLDSLTWIEFQSVQTAHHMHDDAERVRMMCRYLDQQDRQFRFHRSWIAHAVDWTRYQ